MQYLPIILAIAGLLLFIVEIATLIRDHRNKFVAKKSTGRWGTFLAIASLFFFYPLDERTRVFGFPFASFVLQWNGNGWVDFVGPLTMPAAALNFVVALLLPHVLVKLPWISKAVHRSQAPSIRESGPQ